MQNSIANGIQKDLSLGEPLGPVVPSPDGMGLSYTQPMLPLKVSMLLALTLYDFDKTKLSKPYTEIHTAVCFFNLFLFTCGCFFLQEETQSHASKHKSNNPFDFTYDSDLDQNNVV